MSTALAVSDEAPGFEVLPTDAPAAVARPRVLLVGTALSGAGIIAFFAALIGIYLAARHQVVTTEVEGEPGVWLADGNPIPLTPANMAFATMVLSCITMYWAVDSVKRNHRAGAFLALGLTLAFGGAVINATSFLYQQTGLPIDGPSSAGLLFYAVTGAHLALIVGAMVFAALMTFRTLGGEYAGRDREGITAASLIWYLTTAIHGVIWYAVYVTK